VQEHPDRGGDPEKFKEIAKAYEVLSDNDKRAAYDRFGEDGAEGGGGGGPTSPEDVLSMLFGGGMRRAGGGGPSGPPKTQDTVMKVTVSLADCYNGTTMNIPISSSTYERDPEGNIADRAGNRCGTHIHPAHGGERVPHVACWAMVAVTVPPLPPPPPHSPVCAVGRYTRKTTVRTVELSVEKGMKSGQRITFAGMGDTKPSCTPGDVVVVIEERPHESFQRRGADLIMKKEITLVEALTGARFVVEHLDGRKVLVSTKPGDVVAPDSVKEVPDEGMPVYGTSHVKGALFVQFDVSAVHGWGWGGGGGSERGLSFGHAPSLHSLRVSQVKFPERLELTEAMRRVIGGILPGPETPPPAGGAGFVEAELRDPDMEARRARERLAKDAYDSDEDHGGGGGGQRVQCAQQ